MPSDVFLSYSRKDQEILNRLRDDLRAEGIIVWTDEFLEVGTPAWERDIEKALRDTRSLIVLLSPDAYKSDWVLREITLADRLKLRVYPFLVRGEKQEDAIPLRLIAHNWIDARRDYETARNRLVIAICKHLNIESVSEQKERLRLEEAERNRIFEAEIEHQAQAEEQERQRQHVERERLVAEEKELKRRLEAEALNKAKTTLTQQTSLSEETALNTPQPKPQIPTYIKDEKKSNWVVSVRWISIVLFVSIAVITGLILNNNASQLLNIPNTIPSNPTLFQSTSEMAKTPTDRSLTATPTVQPTVALKVTLSGIVSAIPITPIGFNPPNVENHVFGLTTSGGVTGGGFSLLNDTTLFERNPVDPNLYMTTDSSGNMYLTGLNGAGAYRPDMIPFSQFVALSPDDNNAFVRAIKWSPDGRFVSFIVAGKKTANDGVWFFQPGQFPPVQLLVDCLTIDALGCSVVSNPYDPDKWESKSLLWSPNSDALLVGLKLPTENNRDGLVVLNAVNNPDYRNTRPSVFRYDYGSWSRDGNYILVSGRGPDSHEYVAWLNRDGSFNKLMIDSEASGLWMGFANQANDGNVYALGAPGDRKGPREALRVYDMSGQALTSMIGEGFPDRVEWSLDGQALFVQTNDRQYVASVKGEVLDITGQVAGTRAINWVNGELPQGNDGGGSEIATLVGQPDTSSQLPKGVVEGTEYQPGTQLRVYVQELNIRTAPGIANSIASNTPLVTGDYVVILVGPVDTDGARWWQVQTADGVIGWVAGAVNGTPTLGQ